MSNQGMELLFTVAGGASINDASGKGIADDIKDIVKNIEAAGYTNLKFGVDEKSKTAINSLKKQIKEINNSSSFAKNSKAFSLQNVARESTKAMSASTAELTRARIATQNAKTDSAKLVGVKQVEAAAHRANTARIQEENAQLRQNTLITKNNNAAKNEANKSELQAINNSTQYTKILSQARDYYDKYSVNIQKRSGLNSDWQKLFSRLEDEPDFKYTQEARNQLALLQKATYNAKAEVETLGQKLDRLFKTHLSTAIALVGVHLIQQSLQQTYTTVVELDKALVNLQIATGYTRSETKELLQTYSELGKAMGATTLEVANAADTWLRQGKSIAETNTLIKDTMMLSKLGQLDSASASTSLTSAMKGYKLSVEDAIGVVDKFTAVDMKAAVSAGYIATAMSETATSARLAGVDINKLVGYITSVGEITQDGAESVGNFFKTIFARMGNIKLGMLEDPETGESLSDTEEVLEGVGIKLRDSQEEFRDFDEVLDEVAANWDKYGTVQKRAIAVAFSGTRQQEKFLTLLDNYNSALDYTSVAANSAGTALDKYNNTYLHSVEAAQDRLTASFETFSSTVLNSELVKGTFNAGAGLLGWLTAAIDKIGLIPTVLAASGIVSLFKSGKTVKTAVNTAMAGVDIASTQSMTTALYGLNAAQQKVAISALQRAGVDTKQIQINLQNLATENLMTTAKAKTIALTNAYVVGKENEIIASIEDAAAKTLETTGVEGVSAAKLKEILISKGLTEATAEEVVSSFTNAGAKAVEAKSVDILTKALLSNVKARVAALATSPLGILAAIAAAVYLVIKAVDWLTTSAEEQRKKLEEVQQEYDDIKSKLDELNQSLSDASTRMRELQNKGTLTLIEQTELDKLKETNIELQRQIDLENAKAKIAAKKQAQETEKSYNLENDENWLDDYKTYLYMLNNIEVQKKSLISQGKDVDSNGNYTKAWNDLISQQSLYEDELANLVDIYQPLLESYDEAIADNYKLDEAEQKQYDAMLGLMNAYGWYIDANGQATAAQAKFDLLLQNSSFSKTKTELMDLAKTGDVTADDITRLASENKDLADYMKDTGYTAEQLANYINTLGQKAKETTKPVMTLSETMKGLAASKGDLSSLANAYKELEDGAVSFSTLADIQEKFGKFVPNIDEYTNALAKAKGNTQETAQILTSLTYASLNAQLGTEGLANAEQAHIEALLAESQVGNKTEIAMNAIAGAKVAVAAATATETGNSSILTNALQNEMNATGLTRQELANLAAQQIITSTTGLDFSQQCAQLSTLATYAYGASSAMAAVFGNTNTGAGFVSFQKIERLVAQGKTPEQAKQIVFTAAMKAMMKQTMPKTTAKYTSGNNTSGNSNNAYEYDQFYKEKQKVLDIEEQLTKLERELNDVNEDSIEGLEKKNELLVKQNELYKQQQAALHVLNNARDKQITEDVKTLKDTYKVGVTYDPDLNKLVINYEDINKLQGEAKTKAGELADKIEGLNDENKESSSTYEDLTVSIKDNTKAMTENIQTIAEKQKDALNEIIDLTKELIKQEAENKVDALEKQLDTYNDIIEAKKKLLDQSKKESDYEDDIADKTKAIAELQSQINLLSLDGSRETNAKKAELEKQLADMQNDLADTQSDHSIEVKTDALDEEATAFEDNIDKQIDVIESAVDTEAKLYALAIKRIDGGWNTLYNDLISYTQTYGDGIVDNVIDNWDAATQAINRYGTAAEAVTGLNSVTKGNLYEKVSALVAQMKANSAAWSNASASDRQQLTADNDKLAAQISSLLGQKIVKQKASGIWFIGSEGGQKLYDVFHSGGAVSDTPNLKQKEIKAILEKEEYVLTAKNQQRILDLLGANSILGSNLSLSPFISKLSNTTMQTGSNSALNFDPRINVYITGGDMSTTAAKQYGERVANEVLENLQDALIKKGKGNLRLPY